jgi:hypothetical protein
MAGCMEGRGRGGLINRAPTSWGSGVNRDIGKKKTIGDEQEETALLLGTLRPTCCKYCISSAAIGKRVEYLGIDLFHVEGGKIVDTGCVRTFCSCCDRSGCWGSTLSTVNESRYRVGAR